MKKTSIIFFILSFLSLSCSHQAKDESELILRAVQDAQMTIRMHNTSLYVLTGINDYEAYFRQAEKLDHLIRNFEGNDGTQLVKEYTEHLEKSDLLVIESFKGNEITFDRDILKLADSVSATADVKTIKTLLKLQNIIVFDNWDQRAKSNFPFTGKFSPMVEEVGEDIKITPLFIDTVNLNLLTLDGETLIFKSDSILIEKDIYYNSKEVNLIYYGMNLRDQVVKIK